MIGAWTCLILEKSIAHKLKNTVFFEEGVVFYLLSAVRSESGFIVLVEELFYEVLGLGRHAVLLVANVGPLHAGVEDVIEDFLNGVVIEGRNSDNKLVEYDSQTPVIESSVGGGFSSDDFRSYVIRSADNSDYYVNTFSFFFRWTRFASAGPANTRSDSLAHSGCDW